MLSRNVYVYFRMTIIVHLIYVRVIKALKTHSITLTALTAPFSSASIPLALVEWENMPGGHSCTPQQSISIS